MVRSFPFEEGGAQSAFSSQINATIRAVMLEYAREKLKARIN
jgi:hypothetical protein